MFEIQYYSKSWAASMVKHSSRGSIFNNLNLDNKIN